MLEIGKYAKRVVLLIGILLGTMVNAQEPDSLFDQANKFYQQENYPEALELYKEIEENGLESWALYYNMANIYYRTNKVAPAIYYYEKALLLNPNNKDVRFNLAFANQMVLDNIEPLPKSVGQKVMEAVVLRLTYNTWATLAVSFAFLFAFLFLMYHFSYGTSTKRFYFISSGITVGLVTLFVFFAFRNHHYFQSNQEAIIFASESEVMNAPTNSSPVYFELHEGTKVKVLETLDNWKKIRIADGKIGWIDQQDLKEI